MRGARSTAILAASFAAAVSAAANASVFLNGVNVDGAALTQKFEKCTVTFDGKGNVLIDAPGYAIQSLSPAPPTGQEPAAAAAPSPTPGVLTKKYFVVSEQSMPGMTQYDIDLYVNAKFVHKFRSDDDQFVTEITSFIHPGKNKVLFIAKKNVIGERKSFAPTATYQVTLGEGDATGDKVMIDDPLLTFKRSADQTGDDSQEYSVTGR
ncbi:MAG: hypothetical protein ACYCWW_18675 [Deltaproteobacteria bacterium]